MIHNEDVMRSRQLAGRVTRWHTWPMIRKPSVMEHQGRVANIYVELFGLPRAEVLYYCLNHDNGELSAGDTPYGAKRRVPALAAATNEAEIMGRATLGIVLPELTEVEWARFKICDLLEMWETSLVEVNMGNKYCEPSLISCETEVIRMARGLPDETGDFARITVWLRENYHGGV